MLCFENGAFIGADCTCEQMQDIVDQALKEQGSNALFRWLAKKQIPTLERWRN